MTERLKLGEGTAICHYEPQCRYGLEGYNEGDQYRFERWRDRKGIYVKVFPTPEVNCGECVGPDVFLKFFLIQTEKTL